MIWPGLTQLAAVLAVPGNHSDDAKLNATGEEGYHVCQHGIGETLALPDLRQHLLGEQPYVYSVAIPVASLASMLVLVVAVPHLRTLWSVEESPQLTQRARLTRTVAAVPMVVSSVKFLAILAPRIWKLAYLLSALYEVLVFWCFLKLVLNMVSGSDRRSSTAEALDALRKAGPTEMWASPPLLCCGRFCLRPHQVREGDLLAVRVLVWQFIIILPSCILASMFATLEPWEEVLGKLEMFSLLLAMQGLFALLGASHDLLEDQQAHAKFWTIKATFVASTMSIRICTSLVRDDESISGFCYSAGALASAWASMITTVVAIPLACLSRHAFPPEQLLDNYYTDGSDSNHSGENEAFGSTTD